MLPRLLERSGTSATGSITGLYTVLVDGDDMNEPIADAVRAILDGHVVLTRELAHAGHYPAVDVLQSVSRLVTEIVAPDVQTAAQEVRRLMAAYRDKRDLISIGAYERGSDPVADRAIDLHDAIDAFLCQKVDEPTPAETADERLIELVGETPADALPPVSATEELVPPPAGHDAGLSAIPPLHLGVR
jgi:flagellum-specific ATP synthase